MWLNGTKNEALYDLRTFMTTLVGTSTIIVISTNH